MKSGKSNPSTLVITRNAVRKQSATKGSVLIRIGKHRIRNDQRKGILSFSAIVGIPAMMFLEVSFLNISNKRR